MTTTTWDLASPGVVVMPSGRIIRGRALRRDVLTSPDPTFGLYLHSRPPADIPWEHRWIRWPDFWLPTDRGAAINDILATWQRANEERTEVACGGGIGRTGTALACLAALDGLPWADAIAYVRERYHPRAVETPWQRRFVERFPTDASRSH